MVSRVAMLSVAGPGTQMWATHADLAAKALGVHVQVLVASRVMWKKGMAHSSGLMKCMTSRPPGRAATGGTRHGQGYQEARSFA
jgi:hypothetical protein